MSRFTPIGILKFSPIFKSKIWGGEKLKEVLGKEITKNDVGESWEISDVPGDESIVNQGTHIGETLQDLVKKYQGALVGEENYKRFGDKFPLLIKFIDAANDLSVQLHPDDKIAKKKHNSFGKTEMWYILQADTDANIIAGFEGAISPETYQHHVSNNSIKQILKKEPVQKGDTFFIYAGLIHAIGKGVLLAEIQQTSDITYRVYDWDRKDADGNSRDLHQQEAFEALDYTTDRPSRVSYSKASKKDTNLVTCPYFTTDLMTVEKKSTKDLSSISSFVILICVEGAAKISDAHSKVAIRYGETILIPANTNELLIETEYAKFLQVYI